MYFLLYTGNRDQHMVCMQNKIIIGRWCVAPEKPPALWGSCSWLNGPASKVRRRVVTNPGIADYRTVELSLVLTLSRDCLST